MPVITASIDPVTRIEGHLKVDIKVDTVNGVQQVVDAFATGTLFRGFEKIMENRDPRDATIITSRICGVCPTSHSMAAALALDAAGGVNGGDNARLLRNLVHGACFLESHLLHFYLLCLPDYVSALPVAPWLPGWEMGSRLDKGLVARFQRSLVAAIRLRRQAHEMGAIFGGKLPHTPGYIAGGFTAYVNSADKAAFGAYLSELIQFIKTVYIPDVDVLASALPEYFSIGRGYGNLLSYGVFETNNNIANPTLFLPRGRIVNGNPVVMPVDPAKITEHVTWSWYSNADNDRSPAVADTVPQNPKGNAYSWLKAPRYDSQPYECGPLARMMVLGQYTHGVSVMDRHRARAKEALLLAEEMESWRQALALNTSAYSPWTIPTGTVSATGLTEAPRGALGHWLSIQNSKLSHYQVITPTCWTISPRDSQNQRGPLEQALIGTPIENVDKPIEALRVVHSVDPCLDCATHVMRAEPGAKVFALGGV